MKRLLLTILAVFIFLFAHSQSAETEIRKLEGEAREAIIKKDTVAIRKLYSPGFVVNSPANRVETLQNLITRMRGGSIDRDKFEKYIEIISITGNVAVVMGNELVVPTGVAANAGKTVKRRYTNIWVKNENSWMLLARQSSNISVE
jgi:ketosteroid isomerase-like protein